MHLTDEKRLILIDRYRHARMITYHRLRRARAGIRARVREIDPDVQHIKIAGLRWWLIRSLHLYEYMKYRTVFYRYVVPNLRAMQRCACAIQQKEQSE